jgi:acetyl-CoA carboxylase carboxyl transferase subunit beta
MNWLSNLARPGLKKKTEEKRADTPDNLWIKDPLTGDLIFRSDLEAAQWVTPSGFHMRIGADARFKSLFDGQTWQKIPTPKVPVDPLKFKDDKRYVDRLKAARAKSGLEDCANAAFGRIGGSPAVVLVQEFDFLGGSLGMAAGEAFLTAAHTAIRRRAAFIAVTASGGARMQEGMLSLMQMPRTTLAIQEVREAGLPYIVILTDPTTGGVTASYAMLGDIHIAEPGALIGFTGPRVIEQTIKQKLPEGFQRADFVLKTGMVDMVIDRRQIKDTLSSILSILMVRPETLVLTEEAEDEAVEPVKDDIKAAVAKPRKAPTPKPPKPKAAE